MSAPRPVKVFVSYRRDDSGPEASRLHERLCGLLGAGNVFFDLDSLPYGAAYRREITRRIERSDALLAVIGRDWLGASDASGRRRFDDPQDMLAAELVTALERGVLVVPVLVDGARLPNEEELPPALRQLAGLNAAELRWQSFGADTGRLVDSITATVRRPLRQRARPLSTDLPSTDPPHIDPQVTDPPPAGPPSTRSPAGTGPLRAAAGLVTRHIGPAIGAGLVVAVLAWSALVLAPQGPFHDPFPSGASSSAISPDGNRLHVTGGVQRSPFEYQGSAVTTVDMTSGRVLGAPVVLDVGYFGKVALGPDGRYLHVLYRPAAGPSQTRLIVVDTVTDSRVGEPVLLGTSVADEYPDLTVDPEGRYAYVVETDADDLAVVDTRTMTVERTITVGVRPRQLEPSADGRFLFVLNTGGPGVPGTVSVVDTSRREVVGEPIPVGLAPRDIVAGADGRVVVSNTGSGTVTVIAAAADPPIATPVLVGDGPGWLAVVDDRAYVVNERSHTVSVVDLRTAAAIGDPIPVDGVPSHVAVSPDGRRLFVCVSDGTTGQLVTVDSATRAATALGPVSATPTGLGVTADGGTVVVTGLDRSLVLVDTARGRLLER